MSKTQIFTKVPVRTVPRNMFDLSHEVKMSGKFGYLYPVLVHECMPGDSVHDQMTAMCRFAPMLAPIMHLVNVKTDAFFVPMRIITNYWEDFITGGPEGTTEPVMPYTTPNSVNAVDVALMQKGSLWDYMGLPVVEGAGPALMSEEPISMLPFRAYTKIYNDWFRDPNLDDEIDLLLDEEGNVSNVNCLAIRKRGWERDAFTGALPFAQRGPAVLLPLTMSSGDVVSSVTGNPAAAGNTLVINPLTPGDLGTATSTGPIVGFESAELELENTETTINDLRTALAIQRWLENNARGGARYNEQILAHYGQRVSDYRIQRAEYLGGGRQVVQISQVLSTAEGVDVPVGDMAGHGISVGKTNKFKYKCEEHGFVIMVMSVVPKPAYMQGIDKMWSRTNRYDYAFPEFANLGEQEIKSKEVFFSFNEADSAANNSLFGYNPRYWEYKYKQDRVSGDFRDTLLFWHLTRKFLSRPALDSEFVRVDENGNAEEESYRRIFAVTDGTDYLWFQLYHRLTAMRPLPYFGVPELKG